MLKKEIKKEKRRKSEDRRLACFSDCQSGTSAMLSGEANGLTVHGSTR